MASVAATPQAFKKWLTNKLNELNTDESVFGSYIVGILEGDEETLDEKREALEGILSEIINDNLNELINEILDKWNESNAEANENSKKAAVDVDEQLTKLLEAQKLQSTIKTKQYTEEERKLRDKILAQYSQTAVSEDEPDEESDDEEGGDKKTSGNAGSSIERNTNVQDVMQLQKERREQARMDSAAKKQKDKEDREKQKQLREEKKEKRKTVKGERRR